MAGAEIVAAVDVWEKATRTFKRNFPDAWVRRRQLSTITGPEILKRDIGPIDLLIASPECTSHSIAKGNRPRDEESRRSGAFVVEFLRKMGDQAPRWVVLENVVPWRSWHGYSDLISGLQNDLGYNCVARILEATHFDVPQSRKRLFVICDRECVPRLPEKGVVTTKTARDIIDPPGTWKAGPLRSPHRSGNTLTRAQAGIDALGEGVDFLVVYYGSDRAGGWQPLDRPLRTLTTLDRFGLVQWIGGQATLRMLQVPELVRAMGLHDRKPPRGPSAPFRFSEDCSRRERVKLLGNGVCAPVMAAIVRALTQARPAIAQSSWRLAA